MSQRVVSDQTSELPTQGWLDPELIDNIEGNRRQEAADRRAAAAVSGTRENQDSPVSEQDPESLPDADEAPAYEPDESLIAPSVRESGDPQQPR